MDFAAWLQTKGIAADGLEAQTKLALQAAWRAEMNPPAPPPASPSPTPATATPPVATAKAGFDESFKSIEAENARIRHIQDAATVLMRENVGNTEKIQQIKQLADSAIADQKCDTRDFDLAMFRISHSRGPLVFATNKPAMDNDVLEAAVCQTLRLPKTEKEYDDRTLQAAHTHFKRGIGLKELLQIAGERNNGYRGTTRDEVALCKAAFRYNDGDAWQSNGPSTINVTGILSNIANKALGQGFLFTEQAYREISRTASMNDFKTRTTYRLTGDAKFQKIAPSGEIKHGTLGEQGYENKVDQYGLILGVSRPDIINDDIGALGERGMELGRGAGSALNDVFWTEFYDDSTFFTSGHNNLVTDTAAAVFSLANLELADLAFRIQTKEDGTPLGAMPAILLVSAGLRISALNIVNSNILNAVTSTVTPTANVFAGAFRVVSSVYLHSKLTTLWYLLAEPQQIAVMEVGYLNGKDMPTIETAEFDFDRLGLSMRGYMDFGCAKVEYRGGYKSNGEPS